MTGSVFLDSEILRLDIAAADASFHEPAENARAHERHIITRCQGPEERLPLIIPVLDRECEFIIERKTCIVQRKDIPSIIETESNTPIVPKEILHGRVETNRSPVPFQLTDMGRKQGITTVLTYTVLGIGGTEAYAHAAFRDENLVLAFETAFKNLLRRGRHAAKGKEKEGKGNLFHSKSR